MALPSKIKQCLDYLRDWDGRQAFGSMHINDGDCALGVLNIFFHGGNRKKAYKAWWDDYKTPPAVYECTLRHALFESIAHKKFKCPKCDIGSDLPWHTHNVTGLVWHLNDFHRLSFKDIADILEQVLDNDTEAIRA